MDRAVRMPAERFQGKSDFRPLPFFWKGSQKVGQASSEVTDGWVNGLMVVIEARRVL